MAQQIAATAPEAGPSNPVIALLPKTPRRQRPGKKEKLQIRQQLAAEAVEVAAPPVVSNGVPETEAWAWFPLADAASLACPVVFDQDSSYCFIASGATVKIYSVASAQLVSTLTPPTSTTTAADGSIRRTKVSCVLLNPTNPHQLIVGSLDGILRLWDYREGKLFRTLDLGSPVQHACGHSNLPDQLFVALIAVESEKKVEEGEEERAGIYSISLKPRAVASSDLTALLPSTPRTPSRRMRLAQPRIVRSLTISPSGIFLISLNPTTINLCRTTHLPRGFAVQLDSPDALTCLAFHPTENYFATGNERGHIRMWYGVLEEGDAWEAAAMGDKKRGGTAPEGIAVAASSTAVLHWHAHAVASLAFTPNGAYLLSGGEEAVLVLWQLHTGHQEFVPRLGAPILSLSVTDSSTVEQQVAARLRDGTVVFVGSQKLKVSKTISGLKADPVRLSDITNRPDARVPLAIQPLTKSLVLPAGHPSSLQFYSPSDDAQTLELEISPSNRISNINATAIEPTRVEMVSFSTPPAGAVRGAGSYWMATLDTWVNGTFAPARHLKFWRHQPNDAGFTLATRIDRPHDAAITSMAFSPSPHNPLLLTTSSDGRIKVWALVGDSWRCSASLAYRSFSPVDAAWSRDGSMFAVAYPRSVTLWSLASGSLIHAFPCSTIAPARNIEFVGEEGTALLAGGKHGAMVWDLLTFEETFHLAIDVKDIAVKPASSIFVATESLPSHDRLPDATSNAFVVDTSLPSCRSRTLPFAVRQTSWVDSTLSVKRDEVSLAVVNEQGEVILVGEAVASAMGSVAPASRLPSASAGQSRLFDDIFGTAAARPTLPSLPTASSIALNPSTSALAALEMPSHTLPPARLLWRSLFSGFASAPPKTADVEEDVPVEEEDVVMEEESVAAPVLAYTLSPDSLADVFKARLSMVSPPVRNGTGVQGGKSKGGK